MLIIQIEIGIQSAFKDGGLMDDSPIQRDYLTLLLPRYYIIIIYDNRIM